MRGKLYSRVKWEGGSWLAGTVVRVIQLSETHSGKVKVERFPGSPTAWIYLDDMEALED